MSSTLTQLYSDNPQEYANNLRGYLDSTGVPPSAENLNRISLAVAQAMRGASDGVPDFEQAMERTMAPRGRGRASTPPQRNTQPGTTPEQDVEQQNANNRERADMEQRVGEQGNAHGGAAGPVRGQIEGRSENTRGAQVAEANRRAGGPSGDVDGIGTPNDTTRPGTIPRARYIDENNPMAGMFDPAAVGGRQADETDVSQGGLGAAMLAPLAGAGAAAAGRGLIGRMMAQRSNVPAVPNNPYANITGIRPNPPAAPAAQITQGQPVLPSGPGAAALPPPPAQIAAPPPVTSQNFTPARVTVQGRGGASAVRDPNAISQPAGRTALTRTMTSRAERNAGRRVSETAGRSRRDGAER